MKIATRRPSWHGDGAELTEVGKSDLETGGRLFAHKQARNMGLLSSNKALARQGQTAARSKRHGHLVGSRRDVDEAERRHDVLLAWRRRTRTSRSVA
jgi:hypothetical protein